LADFTRRLNEAACNALVLAIKFCVYLIFTISANQSACMSVSKILARTGKAFLTSVKFGIGTFLTLHYVGAFVIVS